jgi:gamma-glutamylputrescine oxidase
MTSTGRQESETYWLEGIDSEDFRPPAALPSGVEVAVIGGGLMGISTAYWLATRGVEVLVLEAGLLSGGATGRNAGLMLPGKAPIEDKELLELVVAGEELDPDLTRPGHLALASSPEIWDRIRAEAESRKGSHPSIHALSRGDCEELLKMRLARRIFGGRWFPGGCAIHPAKLVYGLAAIARRRGAVIAPLTRAVEVAQWAGRDQLLVRTDRGATHARRVVYACNSAVGELLPAFRRLISPVRAQVLSTEPLPKLFDMGMAIDWGTVYWRQAPDGVIVIGGRPDQIGDGEAKEQPTAAGVQAALERFLPETFAGFPPVKARRRWAGVMDFTPDGKPVIGPLPGRPDMWVVVGFGGHGIPAGLRAGKAVAEGVMTGQSPEVLNAYDPARFKELSDDDSDGT